MARSKPERAHEYSFFISSASQDLDCASELRRLLADAASAPGRADPAGREPPGCCSATGPPRGNRSMVLKGARYLLILVLVMVFLLVSAHGAGYLLPALEQCYFPPCY